MTTRPTRLNRGDTLVLATHNKGKIAEFATLLGGYGIHVRSAGELSLPEPEETADSFSGNAAIKLSPRQKLRTCPHWPMIPASAFLPLGGHRAFSPPAGPGRTKTIPTPCAASMTRLGTTPTGEHGSFPSCAWHGPTGIPKHSRAGLMAMSSGRLMARTAMAMTRFSHPVRATVPLRT